MEDVEAGLIAGGFVTALVGAFVLGAIDIALLLVSPICSKSWTHRKAYIIAAILVTIAVLLTGSKQISVGATPHSNYSTLHRNHIGIIHETEICTIGNISDRQMAIVDISMLVGISSVMVPVIFKLPASGMMNGFLAQIGVYVGIHDMTVMGIKEGEPSNVVVSSLALPVVSGFLSVVVLISINRLILSMSDPDDFLQRCLPFVTSGLAVQNAYIFFRQDFILVEIIPLWLKIILVFLVALCVWPCRKLLYQYCLTRNTVDATEEEEESINQVEAQSYKISRQTLSRIASCIGPKWESFIALLGIPTEVIYEIKSNYPYDIHEQSYRCLCRWQERNPKDATLKCLAANMSSKYFNMEKIRSIMELETEGGNVRMDDITPEIKEELDSDAMQHLNISFLLKMQSVCDIFIHGSAITRHILDPVTSLWVIAETKYNGIGSWGYTSTRVCLCLGIIIGIMLFGHRIVDNIGAGGLCDMTPLSCFCIESGFALTTLLASLLGFPFSSTIWKIISIISVGFYQDRKQLNLPVCLKISVMILVCATLAFLINVAVAAAVL